MADDSRRDELFGGMRQRDPSKPNPYAAIPAGSNPFDVAAVPAPTPAPAPVKPVDDAHALLFAGPRAPPKPRAGTAEASAVAAAPRTSPPPPAAEAAPVPEDDGFLALDYLDDLNLTAGHQRAGGDDAIAELNFDEIDSDLAKFAQDLVIKDALARGVDLRIYARQVDAELRGMETASVKDYVQEADSIAGLYGQIESCEAVLGEMQGLLAGFQENLGGISAEIRQLQAQSLEMSVKMANRKRLAGKVMGFLRKVAVPEPLIASITDAPLDDAWLRDLAALSDKLHFTSGQQQQAQRRPPPAAVAAEAGGAAAGAAAAEADDLSDLSVDPFRTPAGKDALPQIDRLRLKAVSRLRDHFSRAIAELGRPKSNMAKTQEYVLLKFAPGMAFLQDFAAPEAREVRTAYVATVGTYLSDLFRIYIADLSKHLVVQHHGHGGGGAAARGGSTSAAAADAWRDSIVDVSAPHHHAGAGAGAPALPSGVPPDPYGFAARAALVLGARADEPPLASHVAQAERVRLGFEELWRSVQRHLMDVAQGEAAFCARFFGAGPGGEVFRLVLVRALLPVFEALESHLSGRDHDVTGVVLLILLAATHRRWLAGRGSDCLGHYFDRLNLLLWPRFKSLLDANMSAVRAARDAPKRLVGGSTGGDTGAHTATVRYAHFVTTVLGMHRALAAESLSDDMLPHHLAALGRDFDTLLQRVAAEQPSRIGRLVFAVNNSAAIVAVAQARGMHAEDAAPFQAALSRDVDAYVEAEMATAGFAPLIAFVRKAEAEVAAAARAAGLPAPGSPGPDGHPTPFSIPLGLPPLALSLQEADAVVRDFNAQYRPALKALADNVGRYFPDRAAALGALKRLMSALMTAYERFGALAQAAFPGGGPLRDLVPTATLFHEIKRYSAAGGGGGAGGAPGPR